MYFTTLSNLRARYSEGQDEILNPIVKKLDTWIMQLIPRATHIINPLQFASSTNSQWDLALRIFSDATKEGFFRQLYQYRDPFTNEIIITQESYSDLTNSKTVFNENTLKDITINPDFIEIVFDLQERPIKELTIKNQNNTFFNSAPPLSNHTLKEDNRGVGSDISEFF